jgi:predicted small lipoprotein YifL
MLLSLMLRQILVSASWRRGVPVLVAVMALAACGQKGALFMPTDAAAAGRATLPQSLNPSNNVTPSPAPATPASAPPATGTASPVRQP